MRKVREWPWLVWPRFLCGMVCSRLVGKAGLGLRLGLGLGLGLGQQYICARPQ